MNLSNHISISNIDMKLLNELNLYLLNDDQSLGLYNDKYSKVELLENKISNERHRLYVEKKDFLEKIKFEQKRLHQNISSDLLKNNYSKIKSLTIEMLENTLNCPNSYNLNKTKSILSITIDSFINDKEILKNLLKTTHSKYSTSEHSIHVAAITANYLIDLNYSNDLIKEYTLATIFHDIGKNIIPIEILNAPRRLTTKEFNLVKTHPKVGYDILKKAGFSEEICVGSLEHHLRLDGSGYGGLTLEDRTPKSEIGKILGIIDPYEAITSNNRNYRKALSSFDALDLLNKDVKTGKIDSKIFNEFSKSIQMNKN